MGKKKGKKGSKKGKKDDKKAPAASAVKNAGPSALELSLRLELEQLEKDLQIAKQEAETAREQNDILTTELRKTEAENGEYEAYMTKKTVREQTKILTLTDKNNSEIDSLEANATRKAAQHARMTKELKDTILERESELEQTRRQVADLSLVQKKRDEQQKEIEQLEATIEEMNKEHFDKLQALKSEYLKEKATFQDNAHVKVKKLEQKAHQEAIACLTHHSHQVKADNRYLKRTLLALINENKSLQGEEEHLTSQNAELERQIELNSQLSIRARTASRNSPQRTTVTR